MDNNINSVYKSITWIISFIFYSPSTNIFLLPILVILQSQLRIVLFSSNMVISVKCSLIHMTNLHNIYGLKIPLNFIFIQEHLSLEILLLLWFLSCCLIKPHYNPKQVLKVPLDNSILDNSALIFLQLNHRNGIPC